MERNLLFLYKIDEIFFGDDLNMALQWFQENRNITLPTASVIRDNPMKLFNTEKYLDDYNDYQFYNLFRMRKRTLFKLVEAIGRIDQTKILSKEYTGGHVPIDIVGYILIYVWYMATQDTLLTIGTVFNVCPKTVMLIVNKVLYFVVLLKRQYIRFPKTVNELQAIARGFTHYPGVAGAIDGTHIFIKVETEHQESYIDRYRRHSINLMAICDSKSMLTYIFAGFPGSAHDSRVFQNSSLFQNIVRHGPNMYFMNREFHLIGDSAFSLRTWLMTPFKGDNLTRVQKHHNFCLSQDRVKVEHTFGIIKGRWRRIQYINTYSIFKAIEITMAACILHNFCLLNEDEWDEQFNEINHFQPGDQDRAELAAREKRDGIANNLFNYRQ